MIPVIAAMIPTRINVITISISVNPDSRPRIPQGG
jgi:hypothetical protein